MGESESGGLGNMWIWEVVRLGVPRFLMCDGSRIGGVWGCHLEWMHVLLLLAKWKVGVWTAGCVHPQYLLPVETVTEAGGMHPTGMHSC